LHSSGNRDCRRELAERLIEDCNNEGSIIVYTAFEKTIINRLIELFPDISSDLWKIVGRLVDLYQILRKNYYHPGFHGSYSIKKVLPVVVPDMGYEGMEVANGLDASALFAYMAMGKYDGEQVNRIRQNLLEYCGVDTMAMVRLVEQVGETILIDIVT
jgi:predicted RecB family nuclease